MPNSRVWTGTISVAFGNSEPYQTGPKEEVRSTLLAEDFGADDFRFLELSSTLLVLDFRAESLEKGRFVERGVTKAAAFEVLATTATAAAVATARALLLPARRFIVLAAPEK